MLSAVCGRDAVCAGAHNAVISRPRDKRKCAKERASTAVTSLQALIAINEVHNVGALFHAAAFVTGAAGKVDV
jgi:hypothetical protein